jgi:DNA polymerase-3 subunit delta
LLKYHGLKDKKSEKCRSSYWSQSFFLKEYDVALKNYPMKKVSQIVALRDIDVKAKE